jgi:hypothetical protein
MYAENRTTEEQYTSLDGNLKGVLNKLRTAKQTRKELRLSELVALWKKQEGRCAITGIEMTYRAREGSLFPYNVSIDRIVPKFDGGTYEIDNIQLVCKIANDIKKHYRGSDAREAIWDFAGKVIAASSADKHHSAADDIAYNHGDPQMVLLGRGEDAMQAQQAP